RLSLLDLGGGGDRPSAAACRPSPPVRVARRGSNTIALKRHTPSNLVVAHWTSDVESTTRLHVLLRHDLWTPFWCLMSCKIRSIISVACDCTTKSSMKTCVFTPPQVVSL